MAWKRARSPQQKSEREREILHAASELFLEHDYLDITLNSIAKQAGFTRSNVYRYFHTKEEIALRLFLDTLALWASTITARIDDLPQETSAEIISTQILDSFLEHPLILHLTPVYSQTIERNSSAEALLRTKHEMLGLLGQLYDSFERLMPGLSENDLFALFMHIHALVAGLWPATHPNPVLDDVLSKPEFSFMRKEFEPLMMKALCSLLDTLKRQYPHKTPVQSSP